MACSPKTGSTFGEQTNVYYRCANNNPDSDHPKVRWRAKDLEDAVVKDLQTLRLAPEYAGWFRKALTAAFANIGETTAKQRKALNKRKSEVNGMQEKLLNAYLGNIIDQQIFESKSSGLKTELADLDQSIETVQKFDPARGEGAVQIFDFSQKAAGS